MRKEKPLTRGQKAAATRARNKVLKDKLPPMPVMADRDRAVGETLLASAKLLRMLEERLSALERIVHSVELSRSQQEANPVTGTIAAPGQGRSPNMEEQISNHQAWVSNYLDTQKRSLIERLG